MNKSRGEGVVSNRKGVTQNELAKRSPVDWCGEVAMTAAAIRKESRSTPWIQWWQKGRAKRRVEYKKKEKTRQSTSRNRKRAHGAIFRLCGDQVKDAKNTFVSMLYISISIVYTKMFLVLGIWHLLIIILSIRCQYNLYPISIISCLLTGPAM